MSRRGFRAAADPEVERRARVAPHRAACQLPPERALLDRHPLQVGGELVVLVDGGAPALDSAGRFQSGDGCHEVTAGEVVRRRKRLAGAVVRLLLGDGRRTEGAASSYAAERPGRPAELALDERAVIHHARS